MLLVVNSVQCSSVPSENHKNQKTFSEVESGLTVFSRVTLDQGGKSYQRHRIHKERRCVFERDEERERRETETQGLRKELNDELNIAKET